MAKNFSPSSEAALGSLRGPESRAMPLIAALSNTLDQIVDAPRKVDDLAFSLQFKLDRIIP